MKDRFLKLLFTLIASALTGVLLFLAFPIYDMGWLAWVGLVPLLLAIHDKSIRYSFVLSLISGIIFTAGIYDWILVVDGYKLHHHAILVFYLALYLGMFGLIFAIVAKRRSVAFALLLSPFVWVSLEYVKSNLLFLSLPWALLAHSQHQVLPIIQIASMTGAYGVSFLVVLANSALAMAILFFSGRSGWYRSSAHLPSRRVTYVITMSTAVLIGLALIYGWLALSRPNNEKGIKVSVLQGNIEQDKKWDPNYAAIIMDTYTDLSRVAAKDQPRLIVWPEAATPGFILKKIAFYKQTAALIRETNIHYLIGSSEYPKFKKTPIELSEVGNSALFFSPQGKVLGQYFKIYLVPFVEFIPYEGFISWPHFISPRSKTSWEIQGKEYTLFEIDGNRFGVSICWESLFPHLFRKFVKQGASFMLNISSEAWFGASAFQYQFLAATKFRAVENRTSIARAGNYTIACFIDPYGRITQDNRNNKEEEILRKGHLTRKIVISHEKTFYTIYGDIFVYIIIALVVLATAYALFKPKMD